MGKIYKNGIEYGGGGGDSAGHIILDNDGTAMAEEPNLQFKGLNVTDNPTDEITEVESVGLNQDSMDDVLNASIPGNQVASNGLVYSTEEQVIGKWIDGKPLYQKTIQFSPSTRTERISHGITNLATVVGCTGSYFYNPGWFVIPRVDMAATSTNWNMDLGDITATQIVVNLGDAVSLNNAGYVTIQYTKTTDTV